jgi:hypothetical protein
VHSIQPNTALPCCVHNQLSSTREKTVTDAKRKRKAFSERSAGNYFKLLSENWLISPLDLFLLPSNQALDPKARKKEVHSYKLDDHAWHQRCNKTQV